MFEGVDFKSTYHLLPQYATAYKGIGIGCRSVRSVNGGGVYEEGPNVIVLRVDGFSCVPVREVLNLDKEKRLLCKLSDKKEEVFVMMDEIDWMQYCKVEYVSLGGVGSEGVPKARIGTLFFSYQ